MISHVKNDNIENFLKNAQEWIFSSPKESVSIYFINLYDDLFACYFLLDCMIKGIEIHEKSISSRIRDIAKKISPEEADRIKENFQKVIKNTEIITIPAYEFFINYLYHILRTVYLHNLRYLKNVEKVEYKGHEIVEMIINSDYSAEFIIEDLINIKVFGTKEEDGNLKTNPKFWWKLIEEMKIKLDSAEKFFWNTFHERRNAASHLMAKSRWEKMIRSIEESSLDVRIWIYGLLFLAFGLDKKFSSKFKLEQKEILINITGEPVYEMETL